MSRDGGNTFTGFKGAPGGDDPQQMWIDPTNGQRMLLGVDQGATVSLDGGRTWSSWYNQSTEQVYHLSVDNSYPYWVYATQQDAGAIRARSRGNLGAITPLDWNPVGGWEWGSIVADPLNPNIVYASGIGHREDQLSERAVDQREPERGSERCTCAQRPPSRSCGRRGTSTSCWPASST